MSPRKFVERIRLDEVQVTARVEVERSAFLLLLGKICFVPLHGARNLRAKGALLSARVSEGIGHFE